MRPLKDDEVWARDCIRQALPGSRVDQHDDGSESGMYDFTVTYPDGTTGAVEITAAADGQQIELWKAVRPGGMPLVEPTLKGGWIVRILPSTRAKNLVRQLPGLLRGAEQAGLRTVRGNRESADQLASLAGRLGIIEASQGFVKQPGRIIVMPPERPEQTGGYVPDTGDPLAQWLGAWIADPSRPDNLSKLAGSGVAGRHLFVLLPGFNSAPFAVNQLLAQPNAPLPVTPPVLPPQITHAWVMSTWDSGDGFRWSPDTGWSRFQKAGPTDDGSETPSGQIPQRMRQPCR
jgi:hypothetical protein